LRRPAAPDTSRPRIGLAARPPRLTIPGSPRRTPREYRRRTDPRRRVRTRIDVRPELPARRLAAVAVGADRHPDRHGRRVPGPVPGPDPGLPVDRVGAGGEEAVGRDGRDRLPDVDPGGLRRHPGDALEVRADPPGGRPEGQPGPARNPPTAGAARP